MATANDYKTLIRDLTDGGRTIQEAAYDIGIAPRYAKKLAREIGIPWGVNHKQYSTRCDVCTQLSNSSPCPMCKEIEALGHLPINAPIEVVLRFVYRVWGEDMTRDWLMLDYGFASDTQRGSQGLSYERIA